MNRHNRHKYLAELTLKIVLGSMQDKLFRSQKGQGTDAAAHFGCQKCRYRGNQKAGLSKKVDTSLD
jgi:hypothetical protein